MYSIMGIEEPSQAEYSLHDSCIANMNRVYLQSAELVAKGCNELGISSLIAIRMFCPPLFVSLASTDMSFPPCCPIWKLSMKILYWNFRGLITPLNAGI